MLPSRGANIRLMAAKLCAESVFNGIFLRVDYAFDSGGGVVGDDFLGSSAEGGGAHEGGDEGLDL